MKPVEMKLAPPRLTSQKQLLFIQCFALALASTIGITGAHSAELPTLSEASASKRDLWGEAAMRQPNGPSYAFFEQLLPPPRYVNAEFHYYPILLSAPNAEVKAHLISNGSGVNLRGLGHPWADFPTSFHFRVGPVQY